MEGHTKDGVGNESEEFSEASLCCAKDGVGVGDGDESEEFSEDFLCCVCLDLLYKPIVLSCGHISCFWCIHKSMNGRWESHCPLCRRPYYHFPTVCQMLHVVLLKMYPVAYKRREEQTLEEEMRKRVFSPQFDTLSCGYPNQESNNMSNPVHSCTTSAQHESSSDPRDNRNGEPWANKAQLESSSLFQENDTTKFNQNCNENTEVTKVVHSREENLPPDGNLKQILLADVLCAACNQLLFHPVVFNCGHVYCGPCIIIPAEGKLTCRVCQTMHPSGSPKVCLGLDNFLEKEFPEEYSLRKVTLQHSQTCLQHESSTSCSIRKGEYAQWWSDNGSKAHFGVGCDFCGMYPIIGDRYRCKDCVEEIGFDLCGECYNTRSKLPGRFNQQHTVEHQFVLEPINIMQNIMFYHWDTGSVASIISDDASENLENGFPPAPLILLGDTRSVAAIISDDASENLENGFPPAPLILLGDTRENAENGPVIPNASNDTEGDEDDIHSAI